MFLRVQFNTAFDGKKCAVQCGTEWVFIDVTRKYSLCGYILGVLTHTTAWD